MKPIQSTTWARAPKQGKLHKEPKKPRSGPDYIGVDVRYSLTQKQADEFKGVFGSLGLGKYLEET